MAAFFVLVNPAQSVTPQCVLPAGLSCTTFYMATNGLLSVTLTPDAGSATTSPVVLTFDLVQDQIYLDRMHIEDLNALPPVPPPT